MRYISWAAVCAAAACFTASSVAAPAASGLRQGSQGTSVTQLQRFLHMNSRGDFYGGAFDGVFGPVTSTGLKHWQTAAGFRATGTVAVGSRQWNKLRHEATVDRLASYISATAIQAARQGNWAVDASKSPAIVTVLHYDSAIRGVVVALSIAAAYGGYKVDDGVVHSTGNGVFRIFAEHDQYYTAHVPGKPWNGAPMPYAACFNGGDCLHYDGLFPSHGCIHIPSWSAAKYIDSLPLGTTVVVH
jgi:hypothetical protein